MTDEPTRRRGGVAPAAESPGAGDDTPKRVFVVLGASGGIGVETVRALTDQAVAVLAIGRGEAVPRSLSEFWGDGSPVEWCSLDLSEPVDGSAVVERAVRTFGRLDGLVNAAAVYLPSPARAMTADQWDRVMAPNLRGALLLSSSVADHLASHGGGRIIQVSSITAQVSRGDYTLYEASKAGLAAAVRSMAVELASAGVTVNAVAPGWIRTPMSRDLLAAVSPDRVAELIPVGRCGEPAEVAEVIAWLATRSPSFLTGQTIVVDGGQTAHTSTL